MDIWKKNHTTTNIGQSPHIDYHSFGLMILLKELFYKEKGHLTDFDEEGYIKAPTDKGESFYAKLEEKGGRLIFKIIGDHNEDRTYLFFDGMVTINIGSNNYVTVRGMSYNEEWLRELRTFFTEQFLPPVQHGHIFAIVRSGQHLHLNTIGDASIPLERGNYTKQVLSVYDAAVKDLNASSPGGRILILEGEPGTGKTHMIRALLNDVPDAMFVLISPDMVPSLAGPDLLPVLITNKQNYEMEGPIVLVLEDADRCLVRREGDNISEIQSLLNLGDGILGSLLDLRIVATTNAKKLDMEQALLRPGRLSQRLEVGPLDFETARAVFHRLVPEAQFPESLQSDNPHNRLKMTLAEVYSLARKAGWEPAPREQNTNVAGGLHTYEAQGHY